MNDFFREIDTSGRTILQHMKEERRRARDEKVQRKCACKRLLAMGRRGVFAIDGDGIAHSTAECYLFMIGPQRRRKG